MAILRVTGKQLLTHYWQTSPECLQLRLEGPWSVPWGKEIAENPRRPRPLVLRSEYWRGGSCTERERETQRSAGDGYPQDTDLISIPQDTDTRRLPRTGTQLSSCPSLSLRKWFQANHRYQKPQLLQSFAADHPYPRLWNPTSIFISLA